jgi:hypothetical protein
MRLKPGHGWRAQPNHKILVLARGAVQLEYPETWFVEPTDDSLRIYDKEPPDDDCVLAVSYHRWPPEGQGLSVASLVRSSLEGDELPFTAMAPIVEESRMDLALAWGEGRFIDVREKREACARLCLARQGEIQALLTFDFWLAEMERCDPIWRSVLATLQLGQWITDPRRGPSIS